LGKDVEALCSSSLIAGVVFGIWLKTGVGIDPEDIMGMIGQAIVGQLAPQYSALLDAALVAILIIGIWQTVTMIGSGLGFGIPGLAMTLLAFFGGVILFVQGEVGVLMMFGALILGRFSNKI
jgi:hypothetical protein